MKDFPKKIKDLRLEKELTQTELAKKINVSQAAIAKWETGDRTPTVDCIIILAKFFEVTTDYLLGLED